MIVLESYIAGSWLSGSGSPRSLFNPSTEVEMARCSSKGIDLASAIQHAREVGVPALHEVGFAGRAEMLNGISTVLHSAREQLIELSISNGGNTRGDAKFDIDGATQTLAAYSKLGAELGQGNNLPDGEGEQLGRTARFWGQHHWVTRPGVAVHINAFNFPVWAIGEKMSQAILAGVPMIVKPGTPTALLACCAARLIIESEILPSGSLQLIAGSAGDLLSHLGPMDAMSFTGSSVTGAQLKNTVNLIRGNVRVSLETDSVNPAMLAPDITEEDDIYQHFLKNVVTDMTQKAGQKCTAVRRILVPRDMIDTVVPALVERLGAVKVGDPSDESVRMGPVASAEQLRDVRAGIQTLAGVGDVACGGPEPIADKGYFVAPTLVVATDSRADAIHRDEVFGPAATVLPYSGDVEEACELSNLGGGCLVGTVYSNDVRWTEQVVLGMSPWHGRIWVGSDKTAGQAFPPGGVMPQMIHGGPGRAGGGEELGGLRGLEFYMQRTALQGYQGMIAKSFGPQ